MPTPFVGQIIMFAGNFAPAGWHLCDGALLSIADNRPLYDVIGTTYGGDGRSTFAVPDLRGRIAIGQGQGHQPPLSNYSLGQAVGVEQVRLEPAQLPEHSHPAVAVTAAGTANVPAANMLLAPLGGQAGSGPFQVAAYGPASNTVALSPRSVGAAGGSQPHSNIQPYQCVNYIIAATGRSPT